MTVSPRWSEIRNPLPEFGHVLAAWFLQVFLGRIPRLTQDAAGTRIAHGGSGDDRDFCPALVAAGSSWSRSLLSVAGVLHERPRFKSAWRSPSSC